MTLWKEAALYLHPATCASHRRCGGGYMVILICHVISQIHVVMSGDFMGRSSLKVSHYRASFSGHSILVVELFSLSRDLARPPDVTSHMTLWIEATRDKSQSCHVL